MTDEPSSGYLMFYARAERMPDRFHELAAYNSEVARGVVHEPAMVDRMRALQADFNEWQLDAIRRSGAVVIPLPSTLPATPCCDAHTEPVCCDLIDCGPCCENCPTCPTVNPGLLGWLLPEVRAWLATQAELRARAVALIAPTDHTRQLHWAHIAAVLNPDRYRDLPLATYRQQVERTRR